MKTKQKIGKKIKSKKQHAIDKALTMDQFFYDSMIFFAKTFDLHPTCMMAMLFKQLRELTDAILEENIECEDKIKNDIKIINAGLKEITKNLKW
jgi:hypothetical protein